MQQKCCPVMAFNGSLWCSIAALEVSPLCQLCVNLLILRDLDAPFVGSMPSFSSLLDVLASGGWLATGRQSTNLPNNHLAFWYRKYKVSGETLKGFLAKAQGDFSSLL